MEPDSSDTSFEVTRRPDFARFDKFGVGSGFLLAFVRIPGLILEMILRTVVQRLPTLKRNAITTVVIAVQSMQTTNITQKLGFIVASTLKNGVEKTCATKVEGMKNNVTPAMAIAEAATSLLAAKSICRIPSQPR